MIIVYIYSGIIFHRQRAYATIQVKTHTFKVGITKVKTLIKIFIYLRDQSHPYAFGFNFLYKCYLFNQKMYI